MGEEFCANQDKGGDQLGAEIKKSQMEQDHAVDLGVRPDLGMEKEEASLIINNNKKEKGKKNIN